MAANKQTVGDISAEFIAQVKVNIAHWIAEKCNCTLSPKYTIDKLDNKVYKLQWSEEECGSITETLDGFLLIIGNLCMSIRVRIINKVDGKPIGFTTLVQKMRNGETNHTLIVPVPPGAHRVAYCCELEEVEAWMCELEKRPWLTDSKVRNKMVWHCD